MSDELARLKVLRTYDTVDTPREAVYDDITRLAAHLCQTPMAVITLIDEYRQWFEAEIGIPSREFLPTEAFCAHTIQSDQLFVVPNAAGDPRFADNPFVVDESGIRFYAGAPLITSRGARIGALAVVDRVPRKLTDEQLQLLRALGRQTMSQLELRLERSHHRITAARLAAAQQVSQMGSWELLTSESKLTWSDEIFRIFGVAPDAFGGTFEAFLALVHPDDRRAMLAAQQRALSGDAPLDITHRIVRPDGTVRHVRERARLMVRDGAEAVLVGTVQDITDECQAELDRQAQQRSLNEALETLSFHVNNSPLAVIEWGPEFTVIGWSAQAECLFGWPEAEVLGLHVDDWPFVHPEDSAAVAAVIDELRGGATRRNVSRNRNLTREGGVLHCEWYNSARLGDDGALLSVFSLVHDITNQVEVERANRALLAREQATRARVEEAEERFRLVAQATADAVWDWNLITDDVWWSSGLQTLFGYAPEELEPSARSWTSRIHPDDAARILEETYAAIGGAMREFEGRYRFRRKDGSYAQVVDRGFVIRDDTGRATRMVGGMSDVTERLALEEQLRAAQRLEALGQLTGGVAHDFNNLLTVIIGNAELLVEALEDAPQLSAFAHMISGAAQRGADLTQRLLAFGRRQTLDPKAVDLGGLVRGMYSLLRRTLGEHIEIELRCPPDLWHALVDPVQLESALLNLCLNARDAMAGGGRLTIETANTWLDEDDAARDVGVEPGPYVLLAVSDTGSGIAPEHLPRVFEPFFTTKPKGKGTGLGLSMVYGFVKQSRGHVTLESEPGLGTVARLYLPCYVGAMRQGAEAGEMANHGGGETILLVEDSDLVRQYAREQLESLGYVVVTASNGPEALAILRGGDEIALLFTDVVMPGGMSGRELAEAARALQPALPVLYTSGYNENVIVHHGKLDAGIQLLAKPYRRADLARKVREVLAGGNER
jgi:PAS domain S-box-containing protein